MTKSLSSSTCSEFLIRLRGEKGSSINRRRVESTRDCENESRVSWISGDVQNNQIDQNASHMASAPRFHRVVIRKPPECIGIVTTDSRVKFVDGYGMEVSEIEAKKGGYASEMGSKVKKALIAESVRDSLHYWFKRVKERSKTPRSVATKSTCPLGSTIDEGDEEITVASRTLSQSSSAGTLNNFRSGYLNICQIA
ncbi:MLO-like protein 4 [Tanacetum coccineum]